MTSKFKVLKDGKKWKSTKDGKVVGFHSKKSAAKKKCVALFKREL